MGMDPAITRDSPMQLTKELMITIVDDSAAATNLLTSLCRDIAPDAQVIVFASAETALPYLAQNGSDLVIVDLTLEEMNGHQLLSRIRNISHHRTTPVVVMSGSQDPDDRVTALAGGALEFVPKSTDLDETERQLRELLRMAADHAARHHTRGAS